MAGPISKQCKAQWCERPREGLNDYCESCGKNRMWPHWLMAIAFVAGPILAFLGGWFQWRIDPSTAYAVIFGLLSLAALWRYVRLWRTPPGPEKSRQLWVTALAGLLCFLVAIANLTG